MKLRLCCDIEPEYFGDALMGSLTCPVCYKGTLYVGNDFYDKVVEQWNNGDVAEPSEAELDLRKWAKDICR